MNILLIVMDTVRAKNTSLHGYHRQTTPYLEKLAQEGHHYTQARAPGRWSIPSHASIFTGKHVWEHQLVSRNQALRTGETVFYELGTQGYATGIFSKNSFLNQDETGLMEDFDDVVSLKDPPFPGGLDPNRFEDNKEFLRAALTTSPLRSLGNAAIIKAAWDFPSFVPQKLVRRVPVWSRIRNT